MFDITDRKTFDDVRDWLGQVRSNCPDDVQLILVGNKLDLETERQVEIFEAEDFAAKEKLEYKEITSRDPANVDEVVMGLTRSIRQAHKHHNSGGVAGLSKRASMKTLPPSDDKDKKQCCVVS